MDDRCIMESLLLTSKGVCDLYMHGTIELRTNLPVCKKVILIEGVPKVTLDSTLCHI